MKQKMVIKVSPSCEKCRKKAMRIAAIADGVMSVALEGDFRDKLVVVGDGVDAACLVATLRKKACHAALESLEEVKPKGKDGDDKAKTTSGGGSEDKPKAGDGGGGKGEEKPKGGGGKGEDKAGKNGGGGNKKDDQPHHHCPSLCCQQPPFCYQQPPFEMYKVVYDSYGPATGCIII